MVFFGKLARRLKIFLFILLLTPFVLFAEFDADDKRILEDIEYWVQETDFWVQYYAKPLNEFFGADDYENVSFNHPSHTLDEFYNLSVGQSNSLGSLLEYLINFRLDYLTRNMHNSQTLTNILYSLDGLDSGQKSIYCSLADILSIDKESAVNSTNILVELSRFRNEIKNYLQIPESYLYDYFNQIYEGVDGEGGLLPINQVLFGINEKLQEMLINDLDYFNIFYDYFSNANFDVTIAEAISRALTNLNYSIDFGIVTNIYEVTTNINNAVQSLSDSQIDDDIGYSSSENLSNSQSTIHLLTDKFYSSTSHLSNLNSNVNLNSYDYDFSKYTNINFQIDFMKGEYNLSQTLSKTNDLVTAMSDTQSQIDELFNDLKSGFTSRTYDSRVTWRLFVAEPKVIDLADYLKFSFDFKQLWDFILIVLSIISIIFFVRLIWD